MCFIVGFLKGKCNVVSLKKLDVVKKLYLIRQGCRGKNFNGKELKEYLTHWRLVQWLNM